MSTIKEIKNTCKACGKIWYYGKDEALLNAANALQNAGKSMMCCTGCFPVVLLPDQEVRDLGKCPECGSKAVESEEITHEV